MFVLFLYQHLQKKLLKMAFILLFRIYRIASQRERQTFWNNCVLVFVLIMHEIHVIGLKSKQRSIYLVKSPCLMLLVSSLMITSFLYKVVAYMYVAARQPK